MSFSEFYCQTTGSNLNAGSTTADAASLTYASGTWVSATGVFTVASGDPVADGVAVGDFASVYADGATVTTLVGRVTARTSTTITVSATAKSGTTADGTSNRTLKIGGAWKGPNAAEGFPFGFITSSLVDGSSNKPRVNLKGGVNYGITAAMTHGAASVDFFEGYTSTPGDGGRAVIDGGTSGASYVLLTITGYLKNITFQNNGASGSANGILVNGTGSILDSIVVSNMRGNGMAWTATGQCMRCEAFGCNQSNTSDTGGFTTSEEMVFYGCVSHDNTGSNSCGFVSTAGGNEPLAFVNCIADSNGADGFRTTGNAQVQFHNCNSHGNGGDGIEVVGLSYLTIENCVLSMNTGVGIRGHTNLLYGRLQNNAFYSNTAGQITAVNTSFIANSITLTGDPFVDAANGDFDLNSTAGAGAACRGAGRGNFTQTAASYTGTLGYPDVGASQHADAGGSSGVRFHPGMGGNFNG